MNSNIFTLVFLLLALFAFPMDGNLWAQGKQDQTQITKDNYHAQHLTRQAHTVQQVQQISSGIPAGGIIVNDPGCTLTTLASGIMGGYGSEITEMTFDEATGLIYFTMDETNGPLQSVDFSGTVSTVIPSDWNGYGGHPYLGTDIEFANGSIYTVDFNGDFVAVDLLTALVTPSGVNTSYTIENGIALTAANVIWVSSGLNLFALDLNTMTPTTYPGLGGYSPPGLEYNACNNTLYLNDLENGVMYSVDQSSGALTLIQAGPSFSWNWAVDPSGTWAYFADGSGDVIELDLNTGTTTVFASGLTGFGSNDVMIAPASDGSGTSLYIGTTGTMYEVECPKFGNPCTSGGTPGCTDPTAHNFDPLADTDDGSCETCTDGVQNGDETDVDCGGALCAACPVPGCMDPAAHNFDPLATVDDGSCETCSDGIMNGDETDIDCGGVLCAPCSGCTDPMACDFDPVATVDDGSCTVVDVTTFCVRLSPCIGWTGPNVTDWADATGSPVAYEFSGSRNCGGVECAPFLVRGAANSGFNVPGMVPNNFNVFVELRVQCADGNWSPWSGLHPYLITTDDCATCLPVVTLEGSSTSELEWIDLSPLFPASTKGIKAYPNPTTEDVLNLSYQLSGSDVEITLTDIQGRVVRMVNANNNAAILDVSNLQNGTYFITITDGNEVLTERFVKQ